MQHTSNMSDDADDDLEAIVDPGELARARRALGRPETARTRNAKVRFACHLLERAPNSMFARLMLAQVNESREGRLHLLGEAVRIGLRRWKPELDGRQPEPGWTGDGPPRLFAACVMAYGSVLAQSGRADASAACLAMMARLDPEDELGAMRTAEREGWAGETSPADPAPGGSPMAGGNRFGGR